LECDVADPELASKIASPPDYVFHVAALANPRDCERYPQLAMRHNVLSLQNVLELAVKWQARRVVFTSSCYLYGDSANLPIGEEEPIYPNDSIYNLTKKMGEDLCDYYRHRHHLEVMCLRLFNCFGPSQSEDYFIPTLITQALAKRKVELWSKEPTRDFTYVADTVAAMVKACESLPYNLPINIGSGQEMQVGDVAEEIAALMEVDVHFLGKEATGPRRLRCNNLRAREVLGWAPKWEFKKGLAETVRWFQEHQGSFGAPAS
jgi:dTDP-glucose 4,6-dehydratase